MAHADLPTGSAAPEITVVIPTRDRREMVVGTVGEVLLQSAVTLEIIVVDDGSQDDTSATLNALNDDRIRVLRKLVPGGAANARNSGIAAARTDWVAFLDDDDRWAPDKLRRQLDAANAEDADFVYAAAVTVDPSGRVDEHLPAPSPAALVAGIRGRNVVPAGASNIIARTALLQALDGFDVALTHLTDWDLWLRLTEAGRPARCPEILVAYMLHEDNIHLRQADAAAREADRLVVKHQTSTLPGSLDRAALDGWAAWAELRAGHHRRAARHAARAAVRRPSLGHARALASVGLQAIGLWRPRRRYVPAPEWLAR